MELNTNSIAFIGLCNEYCLAVENARETTLREFVASMLKLLPRLYIAASDLNVVRPIDEDDEPYLDSYLDEDYYESVRREIETVMGADDVYLEVFEEDMKYSDTPIGASISEGVCDIFQVLYNFITMVRDAPAETIHMALVAVKDEFDSYWSQKLCNLLRPLNHICHNAVDDDEDDY